MVEDASQQRRQATEQALTRARAAAEHKIGRARASTAACLLLDERQNDPRLRVILADSFFNLTEQEQVSYLASYWERIRCPEFEAVLGKIITGPWTNEQWIADGRVSTALIRYRDFQPQKANALIVADISQSRPKLTRKAALSLTNEALPPDFQQVLLRNIHRDADLFKVLPILEQYGNAQLLVPLVNLYVPLEGRWACDIQAGVLRFWIRHDRAQGLAALARAVNQRQDTRCYAYVLRDALSGSNWGEDAQTMVIGFLADREPDVAHNAVQTLLKYGGEQCVAALITALDRLDPADQAKHRPDDTYSPAAVREAIVQGLAQTSRWRLSESQRERLRAGVATDNERAMFR